MKTADIRALVLVSCIWQLSSVLGKADKNYYRAAVLELVQFDDVSHPPGEVVKRNLDVYKTAVERASLEDVDIIVFPECGTYPCEKANRSLLQTFVEDIPDPKRGGINPCLLCQKNQPILTRLSCMAKKYALYLVANVVDLKTCDQSCDADGIDSCDSEDNQCPEDGIRLYNTNVVFDREGTLIAKYYKKHLYFEKSMNTPQFEQDGYFETDFGRFTTLVCFDLIFKESIEDVQRHGVINVAYPTYWYDHSPYIYFSTPYQQAWAITNKVNLLASNGHEPRTGTVGSGIFSADRGALIYTHNPDDRTKLLVSNVPKTFDRDDFHENSKRFFIENGAAVEGDAEEDRDFKKVCGTHVLGAAAESSAEYRCHPSDAESFEFVKLEKKEDAIEACSNDFCCSLQYTANAMDENYFLAISGNDINFYGAQSYGIQSCFIVRCEALGAQPCADFVLQSHTVFRKISLTGNFTAKYVYPFAVDSEVRLTDKKNWVFDGKSSMEYRNRNKISSLLFFGLHGRIYEKDRSLI